MNITYYNREICQQKGMELKRSENVIHPYTHLPAVGEKWGNDDETVLLWYDYENGEQLPTYFGLGTGVQELVDDWYKQRNEWNKQNEKLS